MMTQIHLPHSLRPLLLASAIGVLASMLQGCFPVVAAGAGTAVMSALDRRTSGTLVEDEGIELRADSRLREKLEPNPVEPKYVMTVRGRGYKLVGPE